MKKTLVTILIFLSFTVEIMISAPKEPTAQTKGTGNYKTPTYESQGVNINGLWWAPVNVGYTTENPYGLLFNWGKNEGFKYDGTGQSSPGGNWQEYDQGPCPKGWRVPTEAECQKLLIASPVGTTDDDPGQWRKSSAHNPNGLSGRWFGPDCLTATKTNPGNAVFFPAAGYWYSRDNQFYGRGSSGYSWSSASGRLLIFYSARAYVYTALVSYGVSLRCVQN